MTKITRLLFLAFIITGSFRMAAQTCGNGAPSQQWEDWIGAEVQKFIENRRLAKMQTVNITIPVIVHVVHFGEPYGTYPNIDSNQIKSQIAALNADFSGTGTGVSGVPSYFANKVANTGIQFCLATKDQNDVPMSERGVDRKNAATAPWTDPTTAGLDLKNYFETVIMPASIWDVTKYLNIWVSDRPSGYTLTSFGTYPPGSGQIGLFGNNFGTNSYDGMWIYAKAFGTTGAVVAPTNLGRTATHQIGHWLGLRHTWGDGNCLSDFVSDTPWSKQAHTGCVTSTPPDLCGANTAPNGEMVMNFMDLTDDACKYMFTPGQNVRMQVALTQSPLRNQLGTHNKCVASPPPATASAVASFVMESTQCLNQPVYPFNTSSGYPYPTYVWSSSPAANFAPSSTQANPAITFNSPGTYTISLVTTNSLSSSTYTMLVTANFTCAAVPLCQDSIKMIKNVDTLNLYQVANNNLAINCQSGFAGYLTGTNCYQDKEYAQFFPPTSYSNSIPNPQVNSVIVLFDSVLTKSAGSGQITCRVYGGSTGNGPVNSIGLISQSIANIRASANYTSLGYIGKPYYPVNRKIIPYQFDFASPLIVNANSGFFISVSVPQGSGDTMVIYSNTKYNNAIDSSAWYLNFNGNWRTFRSNRSAKIQLGIIPIITCSPANGIREIDLSSRVTVMPNPGSGIFHIAFNLEGQKAVQLNISNALGQRILQDHFMAGDNSYTLDLSSVPEGVYIAEIITGNNRMAKKIVVSR